MTTEAAEYPTLCKACRLCGQAFDHDGQHVWRDLRQALFDGRGRHVVGFGAEPVAGLLTDPCVCVHCLRNLGLLKPKDG